MNTNPIIRNKDADPIAPLIYNTKDISGSETIKIRAPFTMFYKAGVHGQVLHMGVSPQGMSSSLMPNNPSLHQHDHFELMYVCKGQVTHRIEDHIYTYNRGDACLLNRNTRHCETNCEDSIVVFINFSGEYIREVLESAAAIASAKEKRLYQADISDFLLMNISGEDRFSRSYIEFTPTYQALSAREALPAEELLDQLQLELLSQKTGAEYLLRGLLLRLFCLLQNASYYHKNHLKLDSSTEDFLYAKISNYLMETHGRITRSELSAALNYNAEYLNQIIKKRTGCSLLQEAKNYQLDYIKDLLTNTPMSISAILKEMGLSNKSHFYEFFRKKTGLSPQEYRDKYSAPAGN